jgi:N-acetylmuramoyl-L-alanine amidase
MIALSAGHWERARGAKNKTGFYEYPETMLWARKIHDILQSDIFNIDAVLVPAENLGAKVKFINDFVRSGGVNLAVEIHFNSAPGGKGRGSETLYHPGSHAGKQSALIVQSALGSILPPNRGAKEGWYMMDRPGIKDYPDDKEGDETPDYFLAKTRCPALIIEPAFIQRQMVIEDMRDIACEVIAASLAEVLQEVRL